MELLLETGCAKREEEVDELILIVWFCFEAVKLIELEKLGEKDCEEGILGTEVDRGIVCEDAGV
jgi:hypothetical protein